MKKENRADYKDGICEAINAIEKAFSALMRDPSEKYLKEVIALEIILNKLIDMRELQIKNILLNHGHFLG